MMRLGMVLVALTIVPTVLAAQTDSSRMRGVDSTRPRSRRQQTSSGAIDRTSRRGQRLTHDQVTQLQTALQQANCDPGAIDGVMGKHTRSAMSCARQKNNITGNNPNDLYRSLNLNFTNPDSLGGGANMRSDTSGTSGRSGARASNRGRAMNRTRADSAGRGSTRGDSTRRPSTRKDTTRGPGR